MECGMEARYHCDLCDFKAKHKHNLKCHMKTKHLKDVDF